MNKSIIISEEVLSNFRENVGKYKAETGGLLASSNEETIVDKCYFDNYSRNTSGSFYYDVESMSKVFRNWKEKGYIVNGIYHSHPKGIVRPSYHDISSALLHINFFKINYFYLPIIQPEKRGLYTLYFYVVNKRGKNLIVNLDQVIEATNIGYKYSKSDRWLQIYDIDQLMSYLKKQDKDGLTKENCMKKIYDSKSEIVSSNMLRTNERIRTLSVQVKEKSDTLPKEKSTIGGSLYEAKIKDVGITEVSSKVQNKVIVSIGTDGAISFLENCARNGVKNYILFDDEITRKDDIKNENVYIDEIGKKKIDVIRDRILRVNSLAKVICVDKNLDVNMSDVEFKLKLDAFVGKSPIDYLIIGSSKKFAIQRRGALLALKYGWPYMATQIYERGLAAELTFIYPGVTESCPRCMLKNRFEKYERGFTDDVNDENKYSIFANERINALKGYIALMLLSYNEDKSNPYSRMLDEVKSRNFIEIRMNPYLRESNLGIDLFDRVFANISKYIFFDETLWIPQHPDRPEYGEETCKLCGGVGNLKLLRYKWANIDTRTLHFENMHGKFNDQIKNGYFPSYHNNNLVGGGFEAKV